LALERTRRSPTGRGETTLGRRQWNAAEPSTATRLRRLGEAADVAELDVGDHVS
jgi:hypothetical protein